MTEYSTLCLDRTTWDLFLDADNNIALASPPYALAQDVASAIKTFLGECYYDTGLGVPYWSQILGHNPPLALFKAQMVAAAMTVPGVVTAVCYVTAYSNREITGQVQITDDGGRVVVVPLPIAKGPTINPSPPIFILDSSLLDGSDVLE